MKTNKLKFSPIVLGLLVSAVSATAQSTGTPATCAVAPYSLKSFTLEHILDITTLQSTLPASLPPAVAGMIFSGMYDVHDRISYDNVSNLLITNLFLTAKGAPVVTASTYDFVDNRFAYLVVKVDKIYLTCTPYPAVLVTGLALDGFPVFTDPGGALYAFGFGYTTDNPPVIRDVMSLTAAIGNLYVPYVSGTLSFGTVAAVIAGAPTITTTSQNIVLDGSASVGQPLTYQWSDPSYGLAILSATSPVTPVMIGGGPGTYTVTLTVTNATLGESASAKVNIKYSLPPH
jgi:hypothetical protein